MQPTQSSAPPHNMARANEQARTRRRRRARRARRPLPVCHRHQPDGAFRVCGNLLAAHHLQRIALCFEARGVKITIAHPLAVVHALRRRQRGVGEARVGGRHTGGSASGARERACDPTAKQESTAAPRGPRGAARRAGCLVLSARRLCDIQKQNVPHDGAFKRHGGRKQPGCTRQVV